MPTLTAYIMNNTKITIRPAPLEREWMSNTDRRFAYRCLPLNIGNSHGWEILNTAGFAAYWDGRREPEGVMVIPDNPHDTKYHGVLARGFFGTGTLTFNMSCIFRTDPGIDLYVTGPVNRPKDGIIPLTGIVETDWAPYTFTMNWLFTKERNFVRFEKDEPFCHIFPVTRGSIEATQPIMRPIEDNPALLEAYKTWSDSRDTFNKELKIPEPQAYKVGCQKDYFRGQMPTGEAGPEDHRSKVRALPFKPPEE